jgi:hypothetical protein
LFIILVSSCIYKSTIKLIIRGHLWDKDGWSFNKCDIVEKRFNWLLYDRTRNKCSFQTGHRLIEVTTWAGLTIWNTASLITNPPEFPNMFLMCKKQTYNKMSILKFILQIKYNLYVCLKCNVSSNLWNLMSIFLGNW